MYYLGCTNFFNIFVSMCLYFKHSFECRDTKFDSKIVVTLRKSTKNNIDFDELKKMLESKSFKEIKMDIEGTHVAALPNGHIMVSCYYTKAINIYDQKFNMA